MSERICTRHFVDRPVSTHLNAGRLFTYRLITILLLSGVMGKLIYYQWGRLLALTSATCKSPFISGPDE
jgi:hypothetical protein